MNDNHKDLISIALTISIVGLTLFIIHRFIPSLMWAAVIAISTYPMYKRWCRLLRFNKNLTAFSFTLILGMIFLAPLSGFVTVIVRELQLLIAYLQQINRDGGQAPALLSHFPLLGNELVSYWDHNIGQPGFLKTFIANLQLSITPASYYVKQVSVDIVHRGVQLGFTLLILFFFYRDGDVLFHEINHVGELCLGKRWFRYADKLPSALRGTVNGTIIVGLGVGLLMGICYELVGFPAPTLVGFITAIAAMIPFVVPIVFLVVALFLVSYGNMIAGIIVLVWGTIVMFTADHFIKPALIGGAIKLPFLAVLFGILGGVETLGLLGLFVGPIVMVLFVTLWYESQSQSQKQ